jgi:hypothetical protein
MWHSGIAQVGERAFRDMVPLFSGVPPLGFLHGSPFHA